MVEIDNKEKLRITVSIALTALFFTLYFSTKELVEMKSSPSSLFSLSFYLIIVKVFLFLTAILYIIYLVLTAYWLNYGTNKSPPIASALLPFFAKKLKREFVYDYATGMTLFSLFIPLVLYIVIWIENNLLAFFIGLLIVIILMVLMIIQVLKK